LKTLILFTVALFSSAQCFAYSLFASNSQAKCSTNSWANEGRSQGGGWIWFTGKSSASSLEDAYEKAEVMALDRLASECLFVHREARFHERCDEEENGVFSAYVRVSIKDHQCQEAKTSKGDSAIINKVLQQKLKVGRPNLTVDLSKDQCFSGPTPENWKSCYQEGVAAFQGSNYELAQRKFESACKMGEVKSCYNAGASALAQNKFLEARSHLTPLCQEGDSSACFLLSKAHSLKGDQAQALQVLEKSCELHLADACHSLATRFHQEKKMFLVSKYSQRACELKRYASCYNAATLEASSSSKAKWLEEGCKGRHDLSCHELSLLHIDRKDYQDAVKYAKVACEETNFTKACYNAGLLLLKLNKKIEAKDILNKSCAGGHLESCELFRKSFQAK